jgi:hypothetical protein
MKVAIFGSSDLKTLEEDINKWLKKDPDVWVSHVLQNMIPPGEENLGAVVISIWYEEQ